MFENSKIITRKAIRSTVAACCMVASLLHTGMATADGLANQILRGPNSTDNRGYTSCSVSYTMCIQRYGSRPGSNAGVTRCADCLRKCNVSNGWWPMVSGCTV